MLKRMKRNWMADIILQILETIWKISCLVVCLFFNDSLPYLSDCFLLLCLEKNKIHSVSCQGKIWRRYFSQFSDKCHWQYKERDISDAAWRKKGTDI